MGEGLLGVDSKVFKVSPAKLFCTNTSYYFDWLLAKFEFSYINF